MSRLIFIFFTFCFSEVFIGEVLDSNGNPIENANVQLLNNSIGTITDSDGLFVFETIDVEYDILKISHISYNDFISTININKNSNIKISLTNRVIDYNTIVVTGTRSERHIKNVPMLTHVIGNSDIKYSSYSNVKDILEMAMPNVQRVSSNHGNDRVKIQGLDNKYLTFLVDGDRVSGEFAGNIDFSMFGLSNVEKVEVVEGAMSTLYGSGAIGGVVNIITKKNKEPYWFNVSSQYDDPISNTASINAGFNSGYLNYSLNFQSSDSDGYDLTPDDEGEYNKTLNENQSRILTHRLILSPFDFDEFTFIFKDYSSRSNKYDYFAGNLVVDAPLNRYDDQYYKMKYDYRLSDNQKFKISYIKEKYMKYSYYPYYYSNNEYIFAPQEFLNGMLDRSELNLHYSINGPDYMRLIGVEAYNENYSSYSIYYPDGTMLQESIFSGEDLTENDKNVSLYFYEERDLKSKNILAAGLRIQNLDKENIILPSLSYLIKGKGNYNYRFSYSKGHRFPSIKERYYNWQDHAGGPAIVGNPDLKPTENNYFSFSLDKRTKINDFSLDFYKNDITNMISTEYDDNGEELQYKNYNEVLILGMNVHYYRKISETLKLKFVYNLTDASSSSDEILEGISKHSLRLSAYYSLLSKIDLVANVKYAGEKFIFDQEQAFIGTQAIKELSSYFITDLYAVTTFKKITLKTGVKNIFNYKDPDRYVSNILNNYDPGRRVFFEVGLQIRGSENNE